MTNATTLPRQGAPRTRRSRDEMRAERAEARRMLRSLRQVLESTGRYNLQTIERALAARGIEVTNRTLLRWFNGQTAPPTTCQVEELAKAAGVDLAYLLPDADDEPVPYQMTDRSLRTLAVVE